MRSNLRVELRRAAGAACLAVAIALAGCSEQGDGAPSAVVRSTGEVGLSPGAKRRHSLPLNNPEVVSAAEAAHMRPTDLVVGVLVADQPRAYPWWIVRHYHVVNETIVVSDPSLLSPVWTPHLQHPRRVSHTVEPYIPLLITLCEACSGASGFVPTLAEGFRVPLVFSQCRGFGTAASDYTAVGTYTICDLQTQSRWHPFSGRAGSGPLHGARLERVPVFQDRWDSWRMRHPDTVVLLGGLEMRGRPHGSKNVGELGLPGAHPTYNQAVVEAGVEDRRLRRNELVLGVGARDGSDAAVVPLETLRAHGGVAVVEVAGAPYVFVLSGEYAAVAYSARSGSQVLALRRAAGESFRMVDPSGTHWNERGQAVSGPGKGSRLVPAADSYLVEWSDWIMEHPRTRVIQQLPDPRAPD